MPGNSLSDVKWGMGAVYGAITYVSALLFTAVWFYIDHQGTNLEARESTTAEVVGLTVSLFYNAQGVAGDINWLNFLSPPVGRELVAPVYHAIPVVIILLFAAVYVYAEADVSDRLAAFASGASLAIGYLAVSIVVVLAFRFVLETVFPLGMVVATGIVIPAVLGGVAGLVANEVKTRVDGGDRAAPS